MKVDEILHTVRSALDAEISFWGKYIIIDGESYKEAVNCKLDINFYANKPDYNSNYITICNIDFKSINSILKYSIVPSLEEDCVERLSILENARVALLEMDSDAYSRRCVVQQKNYSNKAACPSFIQFLYRREVAHIFVKYRSQNITNALYDFQTNTILVDLLLKKLKAVNLNTDNIILHIEVVSLHKNI